VWKSKICLYETPYSVTGIIKLTGSNQRPKDICIDSNIGTRKAWNIEVLPPLKY
jgi:hypothetical protein